MTLGISVQKSEAEKILNYLKKNNLVDLNKIIQKSDDRVIVPVKPGVNLDELPQNLRTNVEIEMIKTKFETRPLKHNSISEALEGKIPDHLSKFRPVAFDQIGSIAVVDLKNEILPFQEVIGEAILSFNASIKSVYRKSKAVGGLTRVRSLELLAGPQEFETIHKEYGLKIFVDIAKIYFSPRLSTEHRRVAEQVNDEETVLDMFGAAAPFALHIASLSKATVFTVDINQYSENIIKRSLELNRSLKGNIVIKVGDIIEFATTWIEEKKLFDRIIMNHPSASIKFLKLADQLTKSQGIIHFYSFIQTKNHDQACINLIASELPKYDILDITKVRQYSPSEYHTCITIQKK